MTPKAESVNQMFADISSKYDTANHVLSGGLDFYWRNTVTQQVAACEPKHVVDLATGSGDLAFALKKKLGDTVKVEGMDFCEAMLDEAKKKQRKHPLTAQIPFSIGDCLNLPIEDNTVDAFTIAFGFRNFENRSQGLAEMRRALKPDGHLFILEFTQPENWFRPFYYFYLKHILPIIASLITGHKCAYDYLAGTIENFPTKESISTELQNTGFSVNKITPQTLSTVAIHHAIANKNDSK